MSCGWVCGMCVGRLIVRTQRGHRELVGLGGVDASEIRIPVLLKFFASRPMHNRDISVHPR